MIKRKYDNREDFVLFLQAILHMKYDFYEMMRCLGNVGIVKLFTDEELKVIMEID